jgi:hypothetical protein
MPSPEGGYARGPDDTPRREEEPRPYYRAARFAEEHHAARVYARLQDAILGTPCDLSVYRLLIDRISHVTIVGEPPPAEFDRQVAESLAVGEGVELTQEVLALLLERRRRANRLAPWVERHHRPGRPL